MYLKTAAITAGIVLLIGCAPPIFLKKDLSTNEIAVCTEMGAYVPDVLRNAIDSVTNTFINDYNSKNRKYQLIQCQNDSSRTIYLDVFRISITDPGKQAGGVMITTIGAITPLLMIAAGSPVYIYFAYLPRSAIQFKMSVTKDITDNGKRQTRPLFAGSGKYFGSYELQRELVLTGYYNRLRTEFDNLEKSYRRYK